MGKEATLCTGAGSAALGNSLLTKKIKGKSGKVSLNKKLKECKFGLDKENDIYQNPRANKAGGR